MKKWIFSTLLYLSVFVTVPAAAQHENKHIDAVKIEFLTKKLDLSPEEAQKFWPVYHNYQREMISIFKERRRARQLQKEANTPPDELKFETRILETKKRYRKEFQDVLPAQKADLVFPAEREFREWLINQLRERRQHP
ncbi:hypothetical protein BDE36_4219 [Arcticibacter tournemirensis]|uniref:Sensor of ECF-type sigma factor n=1 Tax=Arcticibacter tournemirensis TaxID=699437 RepID=A0A5M9HAK6_9SPHI|nr:hypothetical protein [Arcticibacter tournemirensis]KAA8482268.1 hypothetical protein F1649_12710 [Arcticibacter tournemirensis]TQM52408.1 hypothetical protein BDE36_4219 [Arcticibacter tournemirensis]